MAEEQVSVRSVEGSEGLFAIIKSYGDPNIGQSIVLTVDQLIDVRDMASDVIDQLANSIDGGN